MNNSKFKILLAGSAFAFVALLSIETPVTSEVALAEDNCCTEPDSNCFKDDGTHIPHAYWTDKPCPKKETISPSLVG